MTTYRVKTTHDVILASLTVLDPQPSGDCVIQTTRRTFSADGSATDQGRYAIMRWSAYTNAAAYRTLLGLFGLSASVASAAVTVYVRDETFTWIRMNGTAIRPEPTREVRWGEVQSRPLRIGILIRDLAVIADPSPSVQDSVAVAESVTVTVT